MQSSKESQCKFQKHAVSHIESGRGKKKTFLGVSHGVLV